MTDTYRRGIDDIIVPHSAQPLRDRVWISTTAPLRDRVWISTRLAEVRMIRCYKYWAVPASAQDSRLLSDQLRLGGDYRRALVDIENRVRALLRALWAEPLRDIPIADRAAWRTAGGDAVIKAWTSSDTYQEWRSTIQRASFVAVKEAYKRAGETGLAWGTRLAVGESVDQARRTTQWVDDLGHAACNRAAVQIQISKPLSAAQLVGGEDTRLRIGAAIYALGDRVDGYRLRAMDEVRNRGGNVRPQRISEAMIRVGSDGRAPIWARLHILMHRPLPVGQIKGAWAQRHYIGGRAKWEFVISIDMGQVALPAHPHATSMVAVDLGWRRRDNGIRIAYWFATDGEGEVVIPIEVERRKGKSDDLRSIRDIHRNTMISRLRAWVEERRGTWLNDALAHTTQWRRMGHFVRLERAWRDQRVDGDVEIYDDLVAFLKRDRHLYTWEAHNLLRMQRQIRGRLDMWAHDLCSRYGVVAIEDLDLTQLKEISDPARINSRSIQRLAPGEVHRAIKQASLKYGTVVDEHDPAYSTQICAECGCVRQSDDPTALVQTCERCGVAEDQDRTAARNLLHASEYLRDRLGEPLAPAKSTISPQKLASRRTRKRVKI